MKKNRAIPFRAYLIMALLFAAVYVLLSFFKVGDYRSYQAFRGLKNEQQLDVIYIGGSDVHAFWQPPFAWNDFGITSWNLSVDSFRIYGIKNYLVEARKTHPDSLYLISVNTMKRGGAEADTIHRAVDYFPFSMNKVDLIRSLCDAGEVSGTERLEYYLPGIRFHSRWNSLRDWEWSRTPCDVTKTALTESMFQDVSVDVTDQFLVTDEREQPDDLRLTVLNELLDYCEAEHVNVLFVTVPQALKDEGTQYGELNSFEDVIQSRGFPCLNLWKQLDEIGLRTQTDFYNFAHTNVHGSLKITQFIGQYLVDHYHFADKRGLPGFETWDQSVEAFAELVNPYTLPIERAHALRDYGLEAPHISGQADSHLGIHVMWNPVQGCDGYEIYRKTDAAGDTFWKLIGSCEEEDAAAYDDIELTPQTEYTYTVVPYRIENGLKLYGNFDFGGFVCKTEGQAG